MKKRNRIVVSILALLMAVVMIVSLAACGKTTSKPTPKPTPPPEEEDAAFADAFNATVLSANNTLADFANSIGGSWTNTGTAEKPVYVFNNAKAQLRVGADVEIKVYLDPALAGTAIKKIIPIEFPDNEKIEETLTISVDAVIDTVNGENGIVTASISLKDDKLLSIALVNEKVGDKVITTGYLGERLIHSTLKWTKLSQPATDFISFVGKMLAEKMTFKPDNTVALANMKAMKDSKFINEFKTASGGMLNGALISSLGNIIQSVGLFKVSKADNWNQLAIDFTKVGGLLEGIKGLLKDVDLSKGIASLLGVEGELETTVNALIELIVGGSWADFIAGKITADRAPTVAIKTKFSADNKLEGVGLSYDGTKGPKNGVQFSLHVQNVVVKNLTKKTAAEIKTETDAVATKAAINKDAKDLALTLTVDLMNASTGIETANFGGLESMNLVVDVYPQAKIGFRKDHPSWIGINFDDLFAVGKLTYKRKDAAIVENINIAKFDNSGLKLDLAPIFDAFNIAADKRPSKTKLRWNLDLNEEFKLDQEYKMSQATPAVEPGTGENDWDPLPASGLFNALGTGNNFLGKFVMEIMNPTGKVKEGETKPGINFGVLFGGIKGIVTEIVNPVLKKDFLNTTITAGEKFANVSIAVPDVKALFDTLMAGTGMIGGSGIEWYKKDELGNVTTDVQTLKAFLTELKLPSKVVTYVNDLTGITVTNQPWDQAGTSISLGLDRTDGLKISLSAALTDGAKVAKLNGFVKLDITGKDLPEKADRDAILPDADWTTETFEYIGQYKGYPKDDVNKMKLEDHNKWRLVINKLIQGILSTEDQFFPPQVEVTFQAGAEAAETDKKVVINNDIGFKAIELVAPATVPEGKVFDGWYTAAEGGEKVVARKGSEGEEGYTKGTIFTANARIYARFTNAPDTP